ncbi:MAG: restriction endonuclease subunit S [Finegoldia sp.]|nr:restriction endonuclease subunit S [Finegoldia sp.]
MLKQVKSSRKKEEGRRKKEIIKLLLYVFGYCPINLKELFNTKNGYTPSKSNADYWNSYDIPWFRIEDIRENGRILDKAIKGVSNNAIKGSPFPANSFIISTSATIGEYALITSEFLCNQRFTCLMIKDEYKDLFNTKFLYYYCHKLAVYCKNSTKQGNFASVDMTKFNNFEFQIIPLEKQEKIVAILDKFDSLCNDLEAGLPAEIEARERQYEYYRDKLLTFK